MQIEQLVIENFRVFSGKHTFSFDNKRLVIIHGFNGHGKSSFFDAIEWCLTGDIQRYVGSAERQKFNYIVHQSLVTQDRTSTKNKLEAKVEIIFKKNEHETVSIRRSLSTQKTIQKPVEIDGEAYAMKQGNQKICEILMNKFLVSDNKGIIDQSKSEFPVLFSSTQFLSQDQLQDFISAKKPKDRYLVLEKVLGVQKYGSEFQQYMKQVKEVVEARKEALTIELNARSEQAKIKQSIFDTKQELMGKIGNETEESLYKKVEILIKRIHEFEEGLSWLQSKSITEAMQLEILEYRKVLELRKDKCDRVKRLIEDAEALFSLSDLDYEHRLKDILTDLENTETKLTKCELGKKRVLKRQLELSRLKGYRLKYQEALSLLNNVNNKQGEHKKSREALLNEPDLVEAIQSQGDLVNFKVSYALQINKNKWLHEFLNVLRSEQGIQLKRQATAQISENITLNADLLKLRKEEIHKLNENIRQHEQMLDGFKNDTVAQIIHNIQSHLLQQLDEYIPCPVCGTQFHDPESLHVAIKKQLSESNRQLNATEVRLRDLLTELSVLETSEVQLNQSITDMTQQRNELLLQIGKEEATVVGDRAKIPAEIKELKEEQVVAQKKIVGDFLSKYESAYELCAVLESLEKEWKPLKTEESVLVRTLQDLRNLAGKYMKLLDLPESSLNHRIRWVEMYLLKQEGVEKRLLALVDELKVKYSVLETKQNERNIKLVEIRKYNPDFNVEERQVFKQEIVSRIDRLINWGRDLADKSTQIEAFLSQNQVMTLKTELLNLMHDLEKERQRINYYNKIQEQLKQLDIGHGKVQSELLDEYLQQYSERIDDLFMQISPHAFFRHVHLVPKKGELFIVVSDKKEHDLSQLSAEELEKKFNASLTFSSAQSNVLAVCIFLALSLSQEWTPLKTIGIDDPFQNLDDINVYSFLDVLSRILLEKQIIISTHDDKFANLVRYKSSLEHHQIAEIWLESYSKDSITIQSDCHSESSVF